MYRNPKYDMLKLIMGGTTGGGTSHQQYEWLKNNCDWTNMITIALRRATHNRQIHTHLLLSTFNKWT